MGPKWCRQDYTLIEKLANQSRMPICYGGGVKTVEQAQKIFNLGVEIGQILFIVGLILIVLLTRQIPAIKQKEQAIRDVAVYAIGTCSAYWLFDRSALLLG